MASLKFVIIVYCLVIAGRRASCDLLTEAETEDSEQVAHEKFLKLEAKMQDYLKKAIVAVSKLNFGDESEYWKLNISEKCLNIVIKMKTALTNMDLWAFEMVDATGLPGRLLIGTFASMGGYQQCLNIGDPEENIFGIEASPPTKGQYCVVNVRIPLPPRPKFIFVHHKMFRRTNITVKSNLMKKFERFLYKFYDNAYTFGLCVPYQCSEDDINAAFNYVPLYNFIITATGDSGLKMSIETCEVKEQVKLNKLQIFIIISAALFSGVCLILSVVDEIQRFSDSTEYELRKTESGYVTDIVRAYSIRRNFEKLMKTKELDNKTFECLNGIRCMAMFWVILGHSYNLHGRTVLGNTLFVRHMISNFFFQVIANGFLAVVTFLFIGSTLISYGVVKSYDCRRQFNPFIIVGRRVFRLLPTMLLAIGIVFLTPLLGSGPTYKTLTSRYYEKCHENWWMTTLFVANIFDSKNMCLGHAWYLCVDMQLFVIGLFYFFILFKSKILAKTFLVVCLIACFVSCGLVIYIESYPPTVVFTLTDSRFAVDYMQKFFSMPYVYLGPYVIGLFLGTYMARVKSPPKISTKVAILGWIAAICLGLTSVYAVYPWNKGVAYSTLEAVSFGSLYRTTWTISVAWVVLACYAGKGGVVKSILSWKGYQPLVRLSYLVYLIHPYVALHYDLSREGTLDADNGTAVYYFCGIVVLTHVICVPLHILYEAPISYLEKIFWIRMLNESQQQKLVSNHTVENVLKLTEKYKINNEMNVVTKSVKVDVEK